MTETPTRYQAHPEVVYTKLGDDEAVLLHLTTQVYYSLNETGVTIWELLGEPRSTDEIVAALAERYEVERAEAQRVTDSFLHDLAQSGLVKTSAAG